MIPKNRVTTVICVEMEKRMATLIKVMKRSGIILVIANIILPVLLVKLLRMVYRFDIFSLWIKPIPAFIN